ncbi:N-acetyllactosaminide beta-1,6-N-acetylglucosaminyl-transferase-like [Ruditapes philippinarum]|uniref:N-acetyllactosaminide beta-1,6-N-acetylglucosaminyl-transferase-like n=1 Tax=Ruditapes philippinarum TaxID=129788 RepID=UPI00295B3E04|nr:N-acetyllactosaminide beta-1,6-N-acetylglucosaminyl-transferase-like [Ruditapes philippinarum]
MINKDNKFDITDLDDHIHFNIQSEEKKQDVHVKQKSARELYKWNGQYDTKLTDSPEYRKTIYDTFKRPNMNAGIDCYKLVENDVIEIAKAKQIMNHFPRRGIDVDKYARTYDCVNFRGGRGYIEHPLSQMELDFPLAFGITAYRDVEQVERLLRSIYRPHNFICLHLDSKIKQLERRAFERIVACLDNVFIADRSLNVTWGEFSVLEAELLCMEKLIKHKKWKYYINLTGQEFPLKTNRELVSILNALDGANVVDGTWIRATIRYFYRWTIAGKPPPHKIRPIKGSVHVAVNRHFVHFALYNQIALDFLEWLKKTQIPDETFFASLNHNPHLGINGSFLGDAEEYPLKPSLMRYKNWEYGHSVYVRGCAGKYVRNVCVLGVGDLNRAYNDIGLFANKFNLDYEFLALDCLEEVMYKKTWDQYVDDIQIDTNYYKRLDYVKKKLFVPPTMTSNETLSKR